MAAAEHLVAWFEPGYVPANRFNLAGHVPPRSPGLCDAWFGQPEQYSKVARHASQQAPVKWIDGSRANFYQDFVVLGNRLLDVRDLENLRRSVSGIDGSFHWRSCAALACSFH